MIALRPPRSATPLAALGETRNASTSITPRPPWATTVMQSPGERSIGCDACCPSERVACFSPLSAVKPRASLRAVLVTAMAVSRGGSASLKDTVASERFRSSTEAASGSIGVVSTGIGLRSTGALGMGTTGAVRGGSTGKGPRVIVTVHPARQSVAKLNRRTSGRRSNRRRSHHLEVIATTPHRSC